VCEYILRGGNKQEFLEKFRGAYSPGFDPDVTWKPWESPNQTTMLRGETEEVQRRLKAAMEKKYGAANAPQHFRFFDTICGATQDRQDALQKLLTQPLDLLVVIGDTIPRTLRTLPRWGKPSCRPISSRTPRKMVSDKVIVHYDSIFTKKSRVSTGCRAATSRSASPRVLPVQTI